MVISAKDYKKYIRFMGLSLEEFEDYLDNNDYDTLNDMLRICVIMINNIPACQRVYLRERMLKLGKKVSNLFTSTYK